MFENEEQVKKFILTYEKYYFKETYKNDNEDGICLRNKTKIENEKCIMGKLRKGEHDIDVIAWKFGRFDKNMGKIDYTSMKCNRTFDLAQYLSYIENEKDNIKKIVKNININTDILVKRKELMEIYSGLKDNADFGFGMVYIINSLFFISKGKVPVYDKYAFKGLKALYYDKSPSEISDYSNPSSKDFYSSILRLFEYMCLLDDVFGDKKIVTGDNYMECECVGYISRSLDRALWVYGHARKKYIAL